MQLVKYKLLKENKQYVLENVKQGKIYVSQGFLIHVNFHLTSGPFFFLFLLLLAILWECDKFHLTKKRSNRHYTACRSIRWNKLVVYILVDEVKLL